MKVRTRGTDRFRVDHVLIGLSRQDKIVIDSSNSCTITLPIHQLIRCVPGEASEAQDHPRRRGEEIGAEKERGGGTSPT